MVALDSVFQFLFFRHEQRKDLFTDFENAIQRGLLFWVVFWQKKTIFENGGIPTWYQRAFHAQRDYFQVWTEA